MAPEQILPWPVLVFKLVVFGGVQGQAWIPKVWSGESAEIGATRSQDRVAVVCALDCTNREHRYTHLVFDARTVSLVCRYQHKNSDFHTVLGSN